jgi:hypothetical protein
MNAVLWIFATLVTEWSLKTIWREVVRRSHAKAAADREDEAEQREWVTAMTEPAVTLDKVWTVQDRLDGIARRIAKLEQ